jgi:Mn-dependent DtxR family transcriptional regulator
MKKVTEKKTPTKIKVISDKIKNLKNTLDYLVFDALTNGELIISNKTSGELELSKRDIKKSAIRLIKKGYVNVYEGRFCLSKKGRKEVSFNYKNKTKNGNKKK